MNDNLISIHHHTTPGRSRPFPWVVGSVAVVALLALPALPLPAAPGPSIAGFSADPGHSGVAEGRIGTKPRLLWQADVGVQGYYNNPVVVGGQLIVSSYGSHWNQPDDRDGVYVLDRRDGRVLRHLPTDSDANGVSTDGIRVYAVTDSGKAFAWELATGRNLWVAEPFVAPEQATPIERLTPQEAYQRGHDDGYKQGWGDGLASLGYVDDASGVGANPRLYGAPLVTRQGLLVAGAGGVVRWLDPMTGRVKGGFDGTGKIRNHSAADGLIAMANAAGEVEVWTENGERLYAWCTSGDGQCSAALGAYSGQWVYAAPAISGNLIAVSGPYYADRQFALVEATTGRTLWSYGSNYDAGTFMGSSKASPAITPQLVLFADAGYASEGRLMAADIRTGAVRWSVDQYGGSWSSPVVVGNKVVWITAPGHLLVLELRSGKVLADHDLGDRFFATPAVIDGVIYVGGDSGMLYAVDTGFGR